MIISKIILEELKKGSKTIRELYEILNPLKQYSSYESGRISITKSLNILIRDGNIQKSKKKGKSTRYDLKNKMIYLQKLTDLQIELGYKKGEIDPVAVLGIAGESGEVLEELDLQIQARFPGMIKMEINSFISSSRNVDNIKKEVRNGKYTISANVANENRLDLEIADLFYYLNALCINRGKSIDYYAKLSFNKVTEKIKTNKVR